MSTKDHIEINKKAQDLIDLIKSKKTTFYCNLLTIEIIY